MLGFSPVDDLALSSVYSGAQWLEHSLMASALLRSGAGHYHSDFFEFIRQWGNRTLSSGRVEVKLWIALRDTMREGRAHLLLST